MRAFVPFLAVVILILIVIAGVEAAGLNSLFAVVIPYAALAVFISGMVYRAVKWGSSPVPFRIPTTCGQQKTLPWIKHDKLENPVTGIQAVGRMLLEVLFFRSLFRNIKTELREGPKLAYGSDKWLWLAGLAFHWSFLIILIRHLRFFMGNLPGVINIIESLDSFLQVGVPMMYMTNAVILASLVYLLFRRFYIPQVRYISLAADYFPLFLIIAIAASGVLMRYFFKVDVEGVKVFTMGLATLSPTVPEGIGIMFYIHLFLISALFAYFPFSKLVHMGGVFMSPTRNLANNSRIKRHINPWNYPVEIHTYEEYEDDFREKMKQVGLPLEKE